VIISVVKAEFAKSKQHQPKISLRFTGGKVEADGAASAEGLMAPDCSFRAHDRQVSPHRAVAGLS
jgi:hypothetical protein